MYVLPNNFPQNPANTFNFGDTSTGEVYIFLRRLSNSSVSADEISSFIWKLVAHYICSPLAYIINLSSKKCRYPYKLKTNRSVPVFKSGSRLDVKIITVLLLFLNL